MLRTCGRPWLGLLAGYREWRSEAASASTDGGREGVVRDAKGGAGAIKEAVVGKVATTKHQVAPKEHIWELQRVLVWKKKKKPPQDVQESGEANDKVWLLRANTEKGPSLLRTCYERF